MGRDPGESDRERKSSTTYDAAIEGGVETAGRKKLVKSLSDDPAVSLPAIAS
jgi:hypothetical protein